MTQMQHMRFFCARVRPVQVHLGYDNGGTMTVTDLPPRDFVEKVIRLDRVLSFTEHYIYIECPGGVAQTWEYEGDLAGIKAVLSSAGILPG